MFYYIVQGVKFVFTEISRSLKEIDQSYRDFMKRHWRKHK